MSLQGVAAVVSESLLGRNFNRDHKWARLVMERDNQQCKVCGGKENLYAYYIFPRDKYPVLRQEDKDRQLVSQVIGY